MSDETIIIINDIRNIIENPDILFTDVSIRTSVNSDLVLARSVIRKTVDSSKKEAEQYKNNAKLSEQMTNLEDKIKNIPTSQIEKKKYSAGVLITRDFRTSGNMMAIREANSVADKKYNDSCDRERNLGIGAFALGTVAIFFTAGAAAPIIAAVGAAAAGHGYAAKKVGRTGSYIDLVNMSMSSLGPIGKEISSSLSTHIKTLILDSLIEGVDKAKYKSNIISLINNFLAGSDIEATNIEGFDRGIQNIIYLMQDLDSIYRAKENADKNRTKVDLSNHQFNILNNKEYTNLFASMNINDQRLIIDSVRKMIIESLEIVKNVVEHDHSANTLKLELNRARTESCIIL
jgi:hypothetical protein